MSISHEQRAALDTLIKEETGATSGNVFTDVRTIKRIALKFLQSQTNSFLDGYRQGYRDRSDKEYDEALERTWTKAFEVVDGVPTKIN